MGFIFFHIHMITFRSKKKERMKNEGSRFALKKHIKKKKNRAYLSGSFNSLTAQGLQYNYNM